MSQRITLRSLTLTLVVSLVLAIAVPLAGQEESDSGTFIDDDGSVHEEAIEAIVAAGITVGCDVDLYCPTDPVTRGQMATFLERALPDLDPATKDWFSDDDGNVHEPAIDVIAENGISLGFPDGTYRPNDAVTRGQMATFLVRALPDLDPATKDWFPDDDGIVHEPAINVIAENGISLGFPDGTYRYYLPVSRGQMASFLARALDLKPPLPPMELAVYFFMETLGDDPRGAGPFLVPVARVVPGTMATATAAMEQLVAGPTTGEAAGTPSISSNIPDGTELLGVVIDGGVATVDLSGEFASGGGSASMLGRVAEVVFTLTQFSTVDSVDFELDGSPIDVLGGEGVILDNYDTRDELLDMLPLVFVDQPFHGGAADNPLRLVGRTAAIDEQFTVAIVDNDGLILEELPVTAKGSQITEPGGTTWTDFDVTIPYEISAEELGAVIVWDTSEVDTSQLGVREYPVTLVPAG